MKRPLAIFGFALLAVLFAGFACSMKEAMYLSAAAVITAAVLAVFTRSVHRQVFTVIAVAALTAVTVFTYNYFIVYKGADAYVGVKTAVAGTLDDSPGVSGSVYVYTLNNCKIGNTQTKYSVSLFSDTRIEAQIGDTLSTENVRLRESKKYSDSEYTDLSYGVYLTASVYDGNISVTENTQPNLIFRAARLRVTIIDAMREFYYKNEAGLLASLILGETSYASEEIKSAFRLSGLSHLFAVSGLHLTLWSGLVYKLFGLFRKRQPLQSIAAMVFVVFFMCLSLFTPSVCRAGIMLLVIYTGNIFKKDADSLNSLGLAVAVLLCINPFYAANASFMLSVFATFSIVVLYQYADAYINEKLQAIQKQPLRRLISFTVKAFVLCLTVSTLLIPLSAYFFGYTSFIAPLANLLCVYPAEIVMILGTLSYILSMIFPPATLLLAKINGFLISYLIGVTQYLSDLPFALFSLNAPFVMPWFVSAAVLCCIYLTFSKNRKYTLQLITLCVCALLLTADIYYYVHKNDVSLSVYNDNKSSYAVITNGFESKIYVSLTASQDSYSKINDFHKSSKYPSCDILVLLSDENSADSKASALITKLSPSLVLCPDDTYISVYNRKTEILADSETYIDIWNGIRLSYVCEDAFRGVFIRSEKETILLCNEPDTVPKNYSSLCRVICNENETITLR